VHRRAWCSAAPRGTLKKVEGLKRRHDSIVGRHHKTESRWFTVVWAVLGEAICIVIGKARRIPCRHTLLADYMKSQEWLTSMKEHVCYQFYAYPGECD